MRYPIFIQHGKEYSIACYPSKTIIVLAKAMNEKLFAQFNWFHIRSSVASITTCEFIAADAEIEFIKKQAKSYVNLLKFLKFVRKVLTHIPAVLLLLHAMKILKSS